MYGIRRDAFRSLAQTKTRAEEEEDDTESTLLERERERPVRGSRRHLLSKDVPDRRERKKEIDRGIDKLVVCSEDLFFAVVFSYRHQEEEDGQTVIRAKCLADHLHFRMRRKKKSFFVRRLLAFLEIRNKI